MIDANEGKALHALATRLTRLPRDPERYVAELDDIVRALRRLGNVGAPRRPASVHFESAKPGKFAPGLIAVDRRIVRVERRGKRAA